MTRYELADAMIRGLKTHGVIESRGHYLDSDSATCMACALGVALIGHYEGNYQKAEEVYGVQDMLRGKEDFDHEIFADLLEIPSKLAFTVESKHINGMFIQQIAAWLKTSEGEGEKWQKD